MQTEEFRSLVKAVVEGGRTLARAEAQAVLATLLEEGASPEIPLPESLAYPLAALLGAMARRGETAEELCGFAEAMRAAAIPLPLSEAERTRLVDTCGTGGDGLDTFNISTAAGLTAAGAGAWVAKHGNRAVTSRCGSADVLEALGVPIALAPGQAAACLRAPGGVFMLATGLQPAMRRMAPVRRALPFRTVFNLLGPLANPAGARAQVVGVYAEERIAIVAEALRMLHVRHAWVVHGHGLDELTVTGESVWAEVREEELIGGTLAPASLGLRQAALSELAGDGSAQGNARQIAAILRGEDRGARREITLLNAAAALVVAGFAATLGDGLEQAAKAVDSGAAWAVVEKLRAFEAGVV